MGFIILFLAVLRVMMMIWNRCCGLWSILLTVRVNKVIGKFSKKKQVKIIRLGSV